MAQLQQAAQDKISAWVLEQLSRTPYACSSLAQPGFSRPGNFVYRGTLAHPLTLENGETAKSIIIKHSTDLDAISRKPMLDVMRSTFEVLVFSSIANFSPLTTTTATVIKAPHIYLYDRETNIQVLEDFSNTVGLKSMLFSANASKLLPPPSPAAIGRHLGFWLRSFHTWALAPEQAFLRNQMLHDDPMRKLKRLMTYESFLGVLRAYPELLEGHEETLETIRGVLSKEFERPPTDDSENWGLLHGDFWSGNILIPANGWREPPLSEATNQLFIIDWEFTQFGHRSYDLGQIVGDLYERKVYNNIDSGIGVMEGVIDGYGALSDEMAFRTAIHIGVHLISWYNRRPQKGPWVASPEAILAGLTVGRDLILKGWEKDRKFFERGELASLFSKQ